MSLDKLNFDEVDEDDLDELVASGVPEGTRLDYKVGLYGPTDNDKREALKDISSFANTFGGHLLLGIDEATGVPTAVPGIANVNPDTEILRLDQLVRSTVEPSIQGLRVRAIPLKSGGHCFVVRVPRSWRPPHRVNFKGSNRFYVRNSGGVHEASVEELRAMFPQGADAAERAREFRDRRVKNIGVRRSEQVLVQHGRAILHVVPLAGAVGQYQLDVGAIAGSPADIRVLGNYSSNRHINLDGLLVEASRGDGNLYAYTQVFRNGAIEAVEAGLHRQENGKQVIWGNSLEARIGETIPSYMDLLRGLGVPPPFVVMLALDGLSNTIVRVTPNLIAAQAEPVQYEPLAVLPEALISDYGTATEYHSALRPLFDAIWNMAGKPRARTFDTNGTWAPQG